MLPVAGVIPAHPAALVVLVLPVVLVDPEVLVPLVAPVDRLVRNCLAVRHHPTVPMARMVRHRHHPVHHRHRRPALRREHHPQHLRVHRPALVQALALVPEVLAPAALAREVPGLVVLVPDLVLAPALAAAFLVVPTTWVKKCVTISLPPQAVS